MVTDLNTLVMHHHQQHLLWIQNCYLIAKFKIHAEVQDLCYMTWKSFLGNLNVKRRVYEDTLKIFPTRHQRQIPDWGAHSSGWICINKNHQGNAWTKTGSHHILQSYYFSYGFSRILSSALHNWNLGTQDQKKTFAYTWMTFEWNIFLKMMQIIFYVP